MPRSPERGRNVVWSRGLPALSRGAATARNLCHTPPKCGTSDDPPVSVRFPRIQRQRSPAALPCSPGRTTPGFPFTIEDAPETNPARKWYLLTRKTPQHNLAVSIGNDIAIASNGSAKLIQRPSGVPRLPAGVTVARVTLDHLVVVRIHGGELHKAAALNGLRLLLFWVKAESFRRTTLRHRVGIPPPKPPIANFLRRPRTPHRVPPAKRPFQSTGPASCRQRAPGALGA